MRPVMQVVSCMEVYRGCSCIQMFLFRGVFALSSAMDEKFRSVAHATSNPPWVKRLASFDTWHLASWDQVGTASSPGGWRCSQ